jgi:glycosyltransferase involved in cell wall biosynthesis
MKPFFTIITVCLNAGEELNKTIISILAQDFEDFKIVLKDGFSIDGSFETVPDDDRILKIQCKDDGIYDAMNQALDYSDGKYVLFLNAGDLLYNNSILGLFHQTINNENFPELVYCDYKDTRTNFYKESPSKLSNFFLFRTMLCHQTCMIKREAYDLLDPFDTGFRVDADYDFLIRLVKTEGTSYKHLNILGIIYDSNGFSFQNREIAKKEVISIRKKHFHKRYYLYSTLLFLTLPAFREKLVYSQGYIPRVYQMIVNLCNRL